MNTTHRLARLCVAAALAAVAVPAAAHAAPGVGEATSFSASFTAHRPHAASGLKLRTTGKPPQAPTTLAPVIRQRVVLPAGAKLRLRALPQCTADDATLAAEGAEAACPARTKVGRGHTEGILDGSPVAFDLSVYAIRGRLFFAGERDGQPLKQGFWGTAHRRTLDLVLPTLDGRIAPTLFRARLVAHPDGTTWLRTPSRCPAGHRWRVKASFAGLADLTSTEPLGEVRRRSDTISCRG